MPLEPMTGDYDVQVDWEEVPDSDLLPDGNYELVILKAEGGWTSTNKLAAELTFQVGAGELEGSKMRPQNFTLGSDLDPQATMPQTRKDVFGWQSLKRVCHATGIRFDQSLRNTLRALEGTRFVATVKIQTQAEKNKDGSVNPYAGNQQNRLTAYYPAGRAAGSTSQAGPAHTAHTSTNGQMPHQTPAPQRRLTAQEVMAQHQAGQVSAAGPEPTNDDDIPF